MSSVGYEFKVTQPDGVETVVRVPDVDLALPELMEHVEAFLVAAGFLQVTIDKYFQGEQTEAHQPPKETGND